MKKHQSTIDYQLLFESAPGLFLILDPGLHIVSASKAYTNATMVKLPDIIKKHIFTIFPDNPDDSSASGVTFLRESLERVLKNNTYDIMSVQKYDIRNPDTGKFEVRYWSPTNFPVFNEQNELQYIIHKVEDVTELVRLRNENIKSSIAGEDPEKFDKNRQTQRMEAMGQLAGGVAHDFNNILTTVILSCENLLLEPQLSETVKKNVNHILKNSEKAAILTRQLLAFSRNQILQPKMTNVNVVVTELQDLLKKLLDSRFDLVFNLAADTGDVLVVPSQVEQILMNLVINARDSMIDGGKIVISTMNATLDKNMSSIYLNAEPGEYVMFSVQDYGCGMDAETQIRAFEPFFTTKELGKGTGLGLSTVYGIVKQTNGTIWLNSEPNVGTVFKIYLPLAKETSTLSTSTKFPVSEITTKNSDEKTVLLVEDEEDLREALSFALTYSGYKVVEATNGIEAYELLVNQKISPNLIVTDVMMPKMTGIELVKKNQALGRFEKILFLSGYADEKVDLSTLALDNIDFLEKPFQIIDLQNKIAKIFSANQ